MNTQKKANTKKLVKILHEMTKVMTEHIHYFKEDVKEDMETLMQAKQDESYLWIVKDTGTWLLNLQDYKPAEYFRLFIENELVTHRYLINMDKDHLISVTKEKANEIAKTNFETKFNKILNYETIVIHDHKNNNDTYYIKIGDNKLIEVEEKQQNNRTDTKTYEAIKTVTKEYLENKIREIYKTIPHHSVEINEKFNLKEIEKIYGFESVTKKKIA